ncbi:hypothetical protein [Streptomyces sp. NPDC005780]|uniref:hypothetical protein n=1 Tax=Streptomyces sp. NPDC005780 TaxID=3364730 RepID=UPI00369DDEC6
MQHRTKARLARLAAVLVPAVVVLLVTGDPGDLLRALPWAELRSAAVRVLGNVTDAAVRAAVTEAVKQRVEAWSHRKKSALGSGEEHRRDRAQL